VHHLDNNIFVTEASRRQSGCYWCNKGRCQGPYRSQHICSSWGETDASAGHDDHMNGLVDDVGALKDLDKGVIIVVVDGGDAEMVHQGVVTLHASE